MPTINRGETQTVRGVLDFSSGTVLAKDGQLKRAWLEQDDKTPFPVDLFSGRVWDAPDGGLPGIAGGDDLGLVAGVWGVDAPTLQSADQQANGAPIAAYARFKVGLPSNWVAGGSLSFAMYGGMITTVSDVSATLDVEVYVADGNGGVGSDLCVTPPQSINDDLLSAGETMCEFDLSPSALVSGDILDCRVAIVIEDAATATAVIGAISQIALLADTKG